MKGTEGRGRVRGWLLGLLRRPAAGHPAAVHRVGDEDIAAGSSRIERLLGWADGCAVVIAHRLAAQERHTPRR